MIRYDSYKLFGLLDDDRNLNRAIPRAENRICATEEQMIEVLESLGVEGEVRRIIRSPGYVMYTVALLGSDGYTKLKKREKRIASYFDVESVRVVTTNVRRAEEKLVNIEIAKPEADPITLRSVQSAVTMYNFSTSSVSIGRTANRLSIPCNIDEGLLIAGKDAESVQNCINSIVMSLLCTVSPDDLEFRLTGEGNDSFECFKDIPHLCGDDVTSAYMDIKAEFDRRRGLFEEAGCRSISDYNAMRGFFDEKPMPELVWVIDDIDACRDYKAEILREIAMLGKESGIIVIAGCHDLESVRLKVLTEIFKNRIAFRVDTKEESLKFPGIEGAEKLVGNRDMLFSTPSRTVRMLNATVSREEMIRVAAYLKENYKEGARVPEELSDEELFKNVVEMLKLKGFISAMKVARLYGVSPEKAEEIIRKLDELEYCEVRSDGPVLQAIVKREYRHRERGSRDGR